MNRNKIEIIISTFGPLHLIKSAEFLSERLEVKVIQGWLPQWWNRWMIVLFSWIIGRDLTHSFKKRIPRCLSGKNYSVGIAEMFLWFGKKLHYPKQKSYYAARLYGSMSCRYIKGADVFHVRSGSGMGGAIEKAKSKGMKVLVDHSIAHPAFMETQMQTEYTKNGCHFDMGMDNPFWKGVIDDCKKGDRILVNSQFVKDTFVENGFSAEKIDVVLLGVREDFWRLKKNYELQDNTLNILFTGSWGFRKGAEYILKALCRLDELGIKYKMTVVGDYKSGDALYKKYTPKNIEFVGFVPQHELKSYLADNDVYLFPSLCEGCASSGMEAMAAGLPVIATKESGLPIENDIDGIIIPSKDTDAIIEQLLRVRSDFSLRTSLGAKAASKISSNFTWEKYADNVVSIYQKMLR